MFIASKNARKRIYFCLGVVFLKKSVKNYAFLGICGHKKVALFVKIVLFWADFYESSTFRFKDAV